MILCFYFKSIKVFENLSKSRVEMSGIQIATGEHFSDKTGKKVLLAEYIKIILCSPAFLFSPRHIL